MFSAAAWDRPSTLLLAAVIGINLLLPIAHFWPDRVAAPPATASRAADDPEAADGPEAAAEAPQAELVPAPLPAPATAPQLARRVTLRRQPPVCRAWGPFGDLDTAEALAARLALADRDFEVFESRVQEQPDYLVTVRVAAAGEAAQRALRDLQEAGVDSYVLESGDRLAAGVFSGPRRARSHQDRLVGLGFDAVVESLPRARAEFHLLARVPGDASHPVPPIGACGDIAPLRQFL